jgi:rhodanese-related sulfurtransferase
MSRSLFRDGFLAVVSLLSSVGCDSPPEHSADDAGRRAEVIALFDEIRARYPSVPPISRAEVVALGPKAVLVDVRPEQERRVSQIAGALDLDSYAASTLPPEAVVVAYCTVGERSGRFAREQRERGIDARNLTGGILGWAHEGGDLVDAEGEPTRRAHVYGPRWDLLPVDWEGIHE